VITSISVGIYGVPVPSRIADGSQRRWLIEPRILLLNILGLVPTALPTLAPVAHQKLEAKGVNLHAWLEADAQIPEIHLVFV